MFFAVNSLSAVSFSGADAENFLQGQLTADVRKLPGEEWRRAAYCLPNGRALATMLLARHEDGFTAVLPAGCAEEITARLSRFVLRAKVKIAPPSGIIDARIAPDSGSSAPAFSGGALRREENALVFDEGGGMCLRFRPGESGGESGGDEWRLAQIRRGIPWVGGKTGGVFVPQYFNWELLGGVSFEKGCYAGQEIIARLHYLGNIKRRGYILRGAGAPPEEGENIGEGGFSCRVINAAPEDGGFAAFVSAPRTADGAKPGAENRTAGPEEPPYGLPSAEEDQKPKPKI